MTATNTEAACLSWWGGGLGTETWREEGVSGVGSSEERGGKQGAPVSNQLGQAGEGWGEGKPLLGEPSPHSSIQRVIST